MNSGLDYYIPAPPAQSWYCGQCFLIPSGEAASEGVVAEAAAEHGEELEPLHLQVWEAFAEAGEVAGEERFLVGGAVFAAVGHVAAEKAQQRIAAPGFAEHGDAVGTEDAPQLLAGGA